MHDIFYSTAWRFTINYLLFIMIYYMLWLGKAITLEEVNPKQILN